MQTPLDPIVKVWSDFFHLELLLCLCAYSTYRMGRIRTEAGELKGMEVGLGLEFIGEGTDGSAERKQFVSQCLSLLSGLRT